MTQKVRKAVLPVAGLGTRFLPATKATPKEMLTVVDKPIIQYVVEEALAAGIEEFVFVTGRGKSAIENHFDKPYELVDMLERKGKLKELAAVTEILPENTKLFYTRQGAPLGLGHAIYQARSVIGDEPFAVLLPDDIIYDDSENALSKMIDVHSQTGSNVVLTMNVPQDRTQNYGVIDIQNEQVENGKVQAHGFVEKPKPEDAPSTLAVTGRYVFNASIFDELAQTKPGHGGEIQLTDAMDSLLQKEDFYGYILKGERFDCGDKFGFQQANLYFALKDEFIGPKLKEYIQTISTSDVFKNVKCA
ncbi:MAG: UTP--glucose-1-phosphate uridylyltransferase GalU [Pseudomonadota bacterium]|nr:UTP--glucose-1-phosphate uridylyltransferase [Magnetococcales bacterium]MEC8067680.1 UTP--glucose-1-phosphate uridylyltransferase GalU [Pseudomonadota bacterium]MEC8467664.1 UTP--glucose-1-phosphate uridylyltransferase GalU [Pseudomonadota bacterium]|tara:strand:+ start:18075 stop:18986 length:912 start_codon:yes stop_codon:yes gene_type:complete